MPAFTLSVDEGVSGFSWLSPPFTGDAPFTLEQYSPFPQGFSAVVAGSSVQVFGSLPAGVDGNWPVALAVRDAHGDPTFFALLLVIRPAWMASETVVDEASLSLGDFYYQLTGGPLRQDFQWPPT